jgi:hypothetical protein
MQEPFRYRVVAVGVLTPFASFALLASPFFWALLAR